MDFFYIKIILVLRQIQYISGELFYKYPLSGESQKYYIAVFHEAFDKIVDDLIQKQKELIADLNFFIEKSKQPQLNSYIFFKELRELLVNQQGEYETNIEELHEQRIQWVCLGCSQKNTPSFYGDMDLSVLSILQDMQITSRQAELAVTCLDTESPDLLDDNNKRLILPKTYLPEPIKTYNHDILEWQRVTEASLKIIYDFYNKWNQQARSLRISVWKVKVSLINETYLDLINAHCKSTASNSIGIIPSIESSPSEVREASPSYFRSLLPKDQKNNRGLPLQDKEKLPRKENNVASKRITSTANRVKKPQRKRAQRPKPLFKSLAP